MEWSRFETRALGKWVLAGEHSVLRGATAVAIPHSQLFLTLSFEPLSSDELFNSTPPFSVEPSHAQPLIEELLKSISDAWETEGRTFTKPQGRLKIDSSIPIGAGLGSSAALCVALTQWMARPLNLPETQWTEFATQLEHRFHGKSSGMDVAVICAGEPISFAMGEGYQPIGISKLPQFTFHDTGLRSPTSECVKRVEKFREESPSLGLQVDEAMGNASRLAVEGLLRYNAGKKEEGLDLIRRAMNQGRECFYAWELVPGEGKRLEEKLLKDGALAVKMTGAGGGGMVVALWAG